MTAAKTGPSDLSARDAYGPRFLTPLFLGPLLNPINTTMVSVALVPISHDLGVPSSTVVWLVAGLYLTSAIAQPTLGRVGDILGPRRVYAAGLVVVAIAGVLPSLLGGFGPVVASRVLLGLGTSAAYPSVMSLIRTQARRTGVDTPAVVLSGISITALTTTVVGPPLGGLLIGLFSWRAIFLVNIPLAAVALVMLLAWVPPDPPLIRTTESRPSFRELDPVGILLFAGTLAALLVFTLDLQPPHWWLIGVSVVALAGLLAWELRHPGPFIDFRMLAVNGGLTRTYLRMLMLYLGFYSMTYGYSQWVQDDAGFSSSQAGLLQIPTAVLAGLMSITIAKRTRLRGPIMLACVAPVVGGLLMVGLHSDASWLYLIGIAAVFGAGQGLASVSNQQVLYRQAPAERIGTASGLSRTFIYLGAICSSGVLGATFGESPSDANMHVVGVVVTGCALVALVVAATDRTLRTRRPGGATRG